jgi:hypothetical protein
MISLERAYIKFLAVCTARARSTQFASVRYEQVAVNTTLTREVNRATNPLSFS